MAHQQSDIIVGDILSAQLRSNILLIKPMYFLRQRLFFPICHIQTHLLTCLLCTTLIYAYVCVYEDLSSSMIRLRVHFWKAFPFANVF